MSHILKHVKCQSNLQRHSFVPFLSAFTQDIVSQLASSSLGDLHLIKSSKNDISQPAAWFCGTAQHQTWVWDFFNVGIFGKAELMMFSHWVQFGWPFWPYFLPSYRANVRESPSSGRVQMRSVTTMWMQGNIVRTQNKQLKTPRVLRKYKQDWWTFTQTHQERKREDIKKPRIER